MNVTMPARVLLSVGLVASIVAQIGFTWFGWTGEHVFNPTWHPHARFHVVQMVVFVILLALTGLWLVWRRTREPLIATTTVAIMLVTYWGAEFGATLVPGTSPSPIPDTPNTVRLLGVDVHGNLLFSGALIAISAIAVFLETRSRRRSPRRDHHP